jgi:hypothetical protein
MRKSHNHHNDMGKLPDNILVQNNMNSLLLKWSVLPFDLSISILWREVSFHLKLTDCKTEYGATRSTTIFYNNKVYTSRTTIYKYMGGHHGDRLPTIETSTHFIKYGWALHSIELIDVNKTPSIQDEPQTCPFSVFYQL